MKKRLLIVTLIISVLAMLCSCAKEQTDITTSSGENTTESMQTEPITEDVSGEITSDDTVSETGYSMEFMEWVRGFRRDYKDLCDGDTVHIIGCAVYPAVEIKESFNGSDSILNLTEDGLEVVPGTAFTEEFVFSKNALLDGLAQKIEDSYKQYDNEYYMLMVEGFYDFYNEGHYQSDYAKIVFNYVLPDDYSVNFEYLNGSEVTFIIGEISVHDYSIDDEFVKNYSEDYTGHQFDSVDELYEWWKNRKEESIFK